MLKEIKYLLFIIIISIFIYFTGKYYFSDENIKKSYRSYKIINEKVKIYSKNLPLLKNDTENIIEYVKQIDKKKKETFKVFFVSIDPERDTPEIIQNYLSSFENKIYGITGDPKKIFVLSQSWGVLSEKIFTEDGNYLINHSSSVMLLENGKYLDRINHHASYKDMLKAINKYLR